MESGKFWQTKTTGISNTGNFITLVTGDLVLC